MQAFASPLGLQLELVHALHLGLLGRLVLAAVLGGVIGLERELSGKAAGLRTNLLICVGAALLMDLSMRVAALPGLVNPATGTVGDPTRIAAQIVSGVGFLGAGTIIQSRGTVVGLTTAATIWVVAAIGMAVGAHAYAGAVGCTVLVFLALVLLGRVEDLVIRRRRTRRYLFVLDPDPGMLKGVREVFHDSGLRVEMESVEKGSDHFEIALDASGPVLSHARAQEVLFGSPGVRRMTTAL
ncbi:MAG TPA: MgtC/SapB family protein [Longimicrobiaceae bacterium]|nr:MgtC/SapB family protein [Longimicrobiaceae bacterium]